VAADAEGRRIGCTDRPDHGARRVADRRPGHPTVGHGFLLADLFGGIATAGNVTHYAAQVASTGLRRRLIQSAQGVIQRAHELDDAVEVAEWAVTEMSVTRDTLQTSAASDVDVHALLGEHISQEWVIEGLLAQGDRLVLTASEGLGKSTLLRQIAVCAAAGLHPFHSAPIDPVKVLVVDCENGRKLSRDRYRPLVAKATRSARPSMTGCGSTFARQG
jgi:hypothetical protein